MNMSTDIAFKACIIGCGQQSAADDKSLISKFEGVVEYKHYLMALC